MKCRNRFFHSLGTIWRTGTLENNEKRWSDDADQFAASPRRPKGDFTVRESAIF